MKEILPRKLVTLTLACELPTSPVTLRPSPTDFMLAFQNGPISNFFVGVQATSEKAESPGIRSVILPWLDLNSYVPLEANLPSKKISPIVFEANTRSALMPLRMISPSDDTCARTNPP